MIAVKKCDGQLREVRSSNREIMGRQRLEGIGVS